MDKLEKLLIFRLSTLSPHGYNVDLGGNTNKVIPEKTRRKISLANKGKTAWNKGKSASSETRKKQSKAKKERNNPMYGRKRFLSVETRDKIALALTGNNNRKAKIVYKITSPKGKIEMIKIFVNIVKMNY